MIDLSTIEARKNIVAKYATKYGLDLAIVCAVCEQESGWNQWATRPEPSFFDRYIKPMNLTDHTEASTRAMSFGLMQVMGQVAREQGFGGKFLTELCDPDVGIDMGCRKLQKCFASRKDSEQALLMYNGGGNAQYGQQVLARVAKYQSDASA